MPDDEESHSHAPLARRGHTPAPMTELHSPPTALVIGASGYIGTHLVPCLRCAGWRVRAAARNVNVLEARLWHDVDLVRADALDVESLPPALFISVPD